MRINLCLKYFEVIDTLKKYINLVRKYIRAKSLHVELQTKAYINGKNDFDKKSKILTRTE